MNDRRNRWWNETKLGTPEHDAAWDELVAPLPEGTYRASDFAKGGLAGALLGGLLGYGSSSLGNYLSDYVGVDPMLPTIRVER